MYQQIDSDKLQGVIRNPFVLKLKFRGLSDRPFQFHGDFILVEGFIIALHVQNYMATRYCPICSTPAEPNKRKCRECGFMDVGDEGWIYE